MSKSKWSYYSGTVALGIARTTLGFPFEHPVDSVKTQWQAKPQFKNEFAIIRHIYANKGFIGGFYAGALPNYTRCILRNAYKYPLIIGLPSFYQNNLPDEIQ